MRRITGINISKSIKSGKLVFNEDFSEKFDKFFVCFICSLMILFCAVILKSTFSPNDNFIKYPMPLIIIILLYVIYRKLTEKKLIEITTNYDVNKNKEIVIEFANEKALEIFRDSREYIILNEVNDLYNHNYKKSTIFLIRNNKI